MTTLAIIRERLAQALEDPTNLKWSENELTEAIRQALDAYSHYLPYRAIGTVTLAAAGREIDLSAVNFSTIDRVWWDYDDADPRHPPAWRDFEIWPGSILYINDAAEPAIDDVVRIWFSGPHTLDGLDGADATTFPAFHTSHLILGASAYAALNRNLTILELANVNSWAARNLREWAQIQLARYQQVLERLARESAAAGSGIAAAPPLDRWDPVRW